MGILESCVRILPQNDKIHLLSGTQYSLVWYHQGRNTPWYLGHGLYQWEEAGKPCGYEKIGGWDGDYNLRNNFVINLVMMSARARRNESNRWVVVYFQSQSD